MPEWLRKEETYKPARGRNAFIDKSILSLLGVLSKIRLQGALAEDKFYVNPVFRVLFTLLLVLLVSLSRQFAFVFVALTYLLVLLCLMPAGAVVRVLRAGALAAAFAILILLPAAFMGSAYSLVMIPPKVFVSILAVSILSQTTKWHSVTAALGRLHVPDVFIFVLDIAIRYIVLLGELSLELLYALKLRSVGGGGRYASLSGVAGTLFIKSGEMAEETHAAMICRGFSGEYRTSCKRRFGFADLLYLLINGAIILIFFYVNRG